MGVGSMADQPALEQGLATGADAHKKLIKLLHEISMAMSAALAIRPNANSANM